MTPTTDLAAVRAAAKRLYGCTQQQIDKDMMDVDACTDYILASIPERPEAEITADWLRDVWGAEEEYADDVVFWWLPIGHDDGVLNVERDSGRVYIHDAGSDRIVAELRHITTRHQFAQLALALGIEPKKGAGATTTSPGPAAGKPPRKIIR